MNNLSNPGGGSSSPLDFVRNFRQNAVNFHNLWQKTGVPPGVQLTTPSQTPITDAQLPPEVLTIVNNYRQSHPNVKVTWNRHMQAVDGNLKVVVEDTSPLPAETALLAVSRTISLNTGDTAQIVTDLFVGSLS